MLFKKLTFVNSMALRFAVWFMKVYYVLIATSSSLHERIMRRIHQQNILQRMTFDNDTIFGRCIFNSDGENTLYMHSNMKYYQELLGVQWEKYDVIDINHETSFNHTHFQLKYPNRIIGFYLFLMEGWGQKYLHLYVFLVNINNDKYVKIILPMSKCIEYSNLINQQIGSIITYRNKRLSIQQLNEAVIQFRKDIVNKYVISQHQREQLAAKDEAEDLKQLSNPAVRNMRKRVSYILNRRSKIVTSQNANSTTNKHSFAKFNFVRRFIKWALRMS